MKIIQQYVNENTGKRYYYSKQPVSCDVCNINLNDFVVVRACWDKKNSFIKQLCLKCSEKHMQVAQAEEKLVMLIVDKKPLGAKLVIIRPLELRNSTKDDSLFCNTIDVPNINNKAKRSGHADYIVLDDSAPVLIGKPIDAEVEFKKDKLIESVDELDALFLSFKNEKILIDEGDKKNIKRLSDGRDDE